MANNNLEILLLLIKLDWYKKNVSSIGHLRLNDQENRSVYHMYSPLVSALKLKMQPVAVILTDDEPEDGLHFKEGSRRGCVASKLVAASQKNRLASFDRKSFGCPGGGTGLGFGDRYGDFPIDCLLSKGNEELATQLDRSGSYMLEGERFYKNPELAGKWAESLPMTKGPIRVSQRLSVQRVNPYFLAMQKPGRIIPGVSLAFLIYQSVRLLTERF